VTIFRDGCLSERQEPQKKHRFFRDASAATSDAQKNATENNHGESFNL